MKGQGSFLKEAFERERNEVVRIPYSVCIYCRKKERTNGLFCEKCFNKDFERRLAQFHIYQLRNGWKKVDRFILKQSHGGRL